MADIVHRSACLPVIREMGLPEARFLAPTHPIHPPTNTHIKPARYYSDHSGLGFGSFQAKHPLRLTLGHGVSCLLFFFLYIILHYNLYLCSVPYICLYSPPQMTISLCTPVASYFTYFSSPLHCTTQHRPREFTHPRSDPTKLFLVPLCKSY